MGFITAKIASGSQNVELDLKGDLLCGYFCPSALTGTLAIKAINPNSGSAVAINGFTSTFAAGEYVPIAEDSARGLDKIRLATGSNEGADREFILSVIER